jgi:transcriptional regulator with XRE-family HTH domain
MRSHSSRREFKEKYALTEKNRGAEHPLFFLQISRTNPGITYLKLHNANHLPQVVHCAMKRKKGRPNSADIQVGESIRAHRMIAGMSQSDLAARLGVSFQQVQKYEKGTNRVGAGRLPQIAAIFNIPISALFDANADTSTGERTANAVPIRLIPDKSALRLLTSFASVTNRAIRHCLIELVDNIAKAERKQGEKVP